MMYPFGYGYDGGFSLLWMGLMMFFMVVGTIGVVFLLVWLLRGSIGYPRGESMSREDPLEIARRRFASGEVTKEQYDEIVKTLRT